MKPEDRARQEIDAQLTACGWIVQDGKEMNILAGPGVAVREFILKKGHGRADYLLYVDGKVLGVIEAKPEGYALTGVETQSAMYTVGLPDGIPHHRLPIPFAYESTGKVTHFTNGLDPDPRSREVFTFHRPEELRRLVDLGENQLRAKIRRMPPLLEAGLWRAQIEAIQSLEQSLAQNRPRSLIQMATGSGKTFTACSFCYRLIKHAKAKRILFLVDRNNLGRQTRNEFQQYRSPDARYSFTEEYTVQRLARNTIDPAAKVCITTIQRLYSMLQGKEDFEEENEEESMFETGQSFLKEPLPVEYNPQIPIETFDFIVIDECHRSIYNVWRQVLDYLDAFLIGLTATPSTQTIGFFNGNVVQDYSHEKAVADGVNVGYDVYRIETAISKGGATLVKEPGVFVPRRDKRTLARRLAELDDDLTYTANQLDRDVVAEDQIRLVVRTFRDRLFTEIFPGRSEVPKTLVFAKTDLHAEDIVKVMREEFGKGNEFCQKITSKTTGKKPEELLNEFRNSYHPRIAVTVDMIATGTDVKALECLVFMRNINSASYFEQMKGRGSRVINPDDLQGVTPDARVKDRFVIVDAVGVCEKDKNPSKPLDRRPSVSTPKLLQMVAQGMVDPELASTLASRLARLGRKLEPEERAAIAELGGIHLAALAANMLASLDRDANRLEAIAAHGLGEGREPTEEQIDQAERVSVAEALKPLHNPRLRDRIVNAIQTLEQVIDETTQDQLLNVGFDAAARERAESQLRDFRQFLDEHKDEIEALQILYSRPYQAGLRYSQVRELKDAIEQPPLMVKEPQERLWRLYEAVEPAKVKGKGGKDLVDLVALVRHALDRDTPLVSVEMTVRERYAEWLADQAARGVRFSYEQLRWLEAIRDHIANSLSIEQEDFQYAPFNQMGGLGRVHQLFGDRLPTILRELNGRLAA